MNPMIVKMLAVGLTISQIFTRTPEQFKANFTPADQEQVTAILHDGCQFMTKQFGAEKLDVENMLTMMTMSLNAMKAKKAAADAAAAAAEAANPAATPAPVDPTAKKSLSEKITEKLDMDVLLVAYKQYCKGEKIENSPVKLDEVIAFYNNAMKDLPAAEKLKDLHLPEASLILDQNGNRFSELYADNGRRHFVSIKDLPDYVRKAFVSAEDKRFFTHPGIDISGIIRAFASSLMSSGRSQGGSTITQQVVKNLLVGDDLTFERKMREMVVATRLEKILSKDQILELYINYIFLGRSSWGIEMASQSYFNKSAKKLTLSEAALLAALPKGPSFYNPDTAPADRVLDRRNYVLGRMKEDGYITAEQYTQASAEKIAPVAFESPLSRSAFYYLDELQRDVKRTAGIKTLTSGSYVVKSTINTELQKVAQQSLEDGLASYEMSAGRALWTGPVGSLSDDIAKYNSTWQQILPRVHSKYYDIQWPLGVITSTGGGYKIVKNKKGKDVKVKTGFMVGLKDGRELPLGGSRNVMATLKVNDLVHVKIDENQKTAMLQIPPRVQGAVVVLEAKTGRVLAMAGGFSYSQSQLNRVTQTARQPGSTLKPFVHLSALNLGYQPNTLLPDTPISLPPIDRGAHWWTPDDYDGSSGGLVTIRETIERSLNLPTAHLMASMAQTGSPTDGLDYIRGITHEMGIYHNPLRVYPLVLGAQPARLMDMAVAYATIANIANPVDPKCPSCMKPTPKYFDYIDLDGKRIFPRKRYDLRPLPSFYKDRVPLYQIRRVMEGTVARGTAVKMKDLTGIVAGKTGTSNDQNDAWFICFTNDIVVATWVGYDDKKVMPSLGAGHTGAAVALPIGERIMRKSFEVYAPAQPLAGAPDDIRNRILEFPIAGSDNKSFEALRIGNDGGPVDTQNYILQGTEIGMVNPAGQVQPQDFSDGDSTDAESYQNDSEYQPVQPGAEGDFDLWQQRGRQVDPTFLQPPFFNGN